MALVSMLLAGACGGTPPHVHLQHTEHHFAADDYDRVMELWTRSTQLMGVQGFSDDWAFQDRLTVTATYFSWEFREAYVARYAHDATLSDGERTSMRSTSLARLDSDHEFYVALATVSTRLGELNRPSSAFHVRLVDDRGREVEPTRIEPIRRLGAVDRAYFPYASPWRQYFHVHFPARSTLGPSGAEYEVLGQGTHWFVLRFGGPLGTADLRWDVASGG